MRFLRRRQRLPLRVVHTARETEFPELAQFIGCWFHQDWEIDAPTLDGALELALDGGHDLDLVARELAALLRVSPESRLEQIATRRLGLAVDPPEGIVAWLEHVQARVEARRGHALGAKP